MKKNIIWVVVFAVLVVIAAVGSYVAFHKSPTTTTSNTSSESQAAVVSNAVVTTKTSSSLGSYLSDPNGSTLYTDGSGTTGVTNCTGGCLSAWPAYQDTGSTTGLPANVSTIKRSDNGEVQYTYKGMPLYYFSSDTKGEVTGNGVSGFSVAKP